MAKPKVAFPAECCGVCKFSHMEEKELVCYANPPQVETDENGDKFSVRGVFVDATDHICSKFKGREHA